MRPQTTAILGGLAFLAVLALFLWWMSIRSPGSAARDQPDKPPTGSWSKDQIADVVSNALAAQGHGHAVAAFDTLVIVPSGFVCNLDELTQLRTGLVRHDMDPAKVFAVMKCSGGAELKLH